MTDVVCDANVVLKWFHKVGEEQVAESLTIRKSRELVVYVLDLTLYEVGNAMTKNAGIPNHGIGASLSAVRARCQLLTLTDQRGHDLAALLADRHGLTFYGAAYAAATQRQRASLVTLDKQLLDAALGETPVQLVDRLGLGDQA